MDVGALGAGFVAAMQPLAEKRDSVRRLLQRKRGA